MKLTKALTAPARLWRYLLKGAGGSYREKYDAMSPVEKEAARWQSMKRNGLFLTFVNLKPLKRRRS